MAEIEFADGKRTVDDAYVGMIQAVTDGSPERYPFQTVMDRMARHQERSILRETQASVIKEHFRRWG